MTLNDTLLYQLAGSLNGEAYDNPSHAGFSSTAITIDPTSSSLSGEFGSRVVVSGSRTLNEVSFNGLKTGAVVSSVGESISSFGLFNASSSGDLQAHALTASLLHTSDFDIEVDWVISVQRKS